MITSPIDLACFDKLGFALISLRSEKHRAQDAIPYELKEADAAQQMAEEHAQETGKHWKYFDKVIDDNGMY